MADYPTPHIEASPEDFAKTVLMPGDPKRSEFIAKNYLENARQINEVRCAYGYTGEYKGKRVTVMSSGIGMPSAAIYSYEMFNIFGVDNIIRVGTAGAISEDVRVRDIIFALGASTTSSFASQYSLNGTFAPVCSYPLLKRYTETADSKGVKYHVGGVLTTDAFYDDTGSDGKNETTQMIWKKMGVLAVEMECAALYMCAARAKKNALCICTVSDHMLTGEKTTALERQTSFGEMIELALDGIPD